jgi:hypothetical protein
LDCRRCHPTRGRGGYQEMQDGKNRSKIVVAQIVRGCIGEGDCRRCHPTRGRGGYQEMPATKRCRLPRDAGYQEMPATKRCRLPRDASCISVPTSVEKQDEIFPLVAIGSPDPILPVCNRAETTACHSAQNDASAPQMKSPDRLLMHRHQIRIRNHSSRSTGRKPSRSDRCRGDYQGH